MDGEVYYHQNLFINLMFIAFVLMWLGVCFALANILNDKILTVLRNLSSRVTAVYVFQYLLIIYISVLVFGEETPLNAGLTLGLFAVYMIVSCLGAGCYQKIALNIRQKRYAVSAVNRVH